MNEIYAKSIYENKGQYLFCIPLLVPQRSSHPFHRIDGLLTFLPQQDGNQDAGVSGVVWISS